MKKFILLLILAVALPLCSVADVGYVNCCVNYDRECCLQLKTDWKEYVIARDIAKADNGSDIEIKLAKYNTVYELAVKLNRPDLQAHQLNNSAYFLIQTHIALGKIDRNLIVRALELLTKALTIDFSFFEKYEYNTSLKEKIKNNINYCNEHLK